MTEKTPLNSALAASLKNSTMKKEIRYRLNGLEYMIHSLHHNAKLMEYMFYGLHKEPFNLFNNIGLHWIWGQTMGNQIMTFYKVMMKEEKFSFMKIINVARDLKCDVDFGLLEKETNALKAEYHKTNFETVRSKYIAHQDLRIPEVRTGLLTIVSLTEKIIELFFLFSREFKGRKVKLSNHIVDSLDKIFETIDEYEWVKAFLIAELTKDNDTVKLSRIKAVVKEYRKDVKKKEQEKRKGG
ncbi:hypothetical protein ACFL9U_06780 [Thermodesulfobacteriota bacterium]